MSDWPIYAGGGRLTSDGQEVLTLSDMLAVAASGTIHVKGGWGVLNAALPLPTAGIILRMRNATAANRHAFDLGLGGAGVEVPILTDVPYDSGFGTGVYLPLALPRGERLTARVQSDVASSNLRMAVTLIGASPKMPTGLQRGTTYGVNLATTRGVLLDAGAVANTKSGWFDITTSSTYALRQMVACAQQGSANAATAQVLLDIGVWDGAAYQVLVPNLFYSTRSSGNKTHPQFLGPFPVNLPAGSKLGARIQCSSNTAGDRTMDFALLGLD